MHGTLCSIHEEITEVISTLNLTISISNYYQYSLKKLKSKEQNKKGATFFVAP
jgi:hypothetical protein